MAPEFASASGMWLLIYLFPLFFPLFLVAQEEIILQSGASIKLNAPNQQTVKVFNGKVLKAIDLGNTIEVIGKRSGHSQLQLGLRNYSIHVLKPTQYRTYKKLQHWLKGRYGLLLKIRRGKIHIEGELLRVEDWPSIPPKAIGRPAFIFSATIHSSISKQLNTKIDQDLKDLELPPINYSLQPTARVQLGKSRQVFRQRYQAYFLPLGFTIVNADEKLELEPLVEIRIQAAEINRDSLNRFGLQWPQAYSARLMAPSGKFQGGDAAFLLHALEQRGQARILASPTLLCRSGESAEFFAGGEFPVKISSLEKQDVKWKKYGVLLQVSPLANWLGNMSISLTTEISAVDPAFSLDGLPAINKNRVQTHFDLAQSKTIALSGMIKYHKSQSRQGLPLLNRLPVLGSLFSSQAWQENRSELVIFVTPRTISALNVNDKDKLKQMEDWFSGTK